MSISSSFLLAFSLADTNDSERAIARDKSDSSTAFFRGLLTFLSAFSSGFGLFNGFSSTVPLSLASLTDVVASTFSITSQLSGNWLAAINNFAAGTTLVAFLLTGIWKWVIYLYSVWLYVYPFPYLSDFDGRVIRKSSILSSSEDWVARDCEPALESFSIFLLGNIFINR